jgi:hypothetical protein
MPSSGWQDQPLDGRQTWILAGLPLVWPVFV